MDSFSVFEQKDAIKRCFWSSGRKRKLFTFRPVDWIFSSERGFDLTIQFFIKSRLFGTQICWVFGWSLSRWKSMDYFSLESTNEKVTEQNQLECKHVDGLREAWNHKNETFSISPLQVFAVRHSHKDRAPEQSSELGRPLHHADQSAPSWTRRVWTPI